jgi:iron-sulfur cluster repair protein YtfE (RIC family)
MDETLQLIDQLIAEHKVINERTGALEKAANDASLLSNLKEARDTFMPGDATQNENLQKLEEMLKTIYACLEKHFDREENVLLPAVKKYGDEKLVTTLNSLLFEHTDLRDRLSHSRKRVTELLSGRLARNLWDATASDIRTYLSHTRKLLATHAARENHFFKELRRYLKKTSNRKEKTP